LIDEDQYRSTYRQVNELPCPFERAILANRCRCSLSERILLAEREAAACRSAAARADCMALLEALREKSRFALKLTHVPGPLPFGKEIKVQVGGMLGLQAIIEPDLGDALPVRDVRAMVREAVDRFGSLDALPYERLVSSVAGYQHRKRR